MTFVPYQFSRDFPNESSQAPESMPQLGIDRKARYVIWVGDLEAGPRPGRGGAALAQRGPRVRFSGLWANRGPTPGASATHGRRVRFSVAGPPVDASRARARGGENMYNGIGVIEPYMQRMAKPKFLRMNTQRS